jgi:hypothetical protein
MGIEMMTKSYRVYDNRTGSVTVVRADEMSAYERHMAEESDRQAYRSNR